MNPDRPRPARNRIWIVDDDETALLLAQDLLEGDEFLIETFADPLSALQRLETQLPDLIVLDVLMPRLDGFRFCARLRAHPVARHVPVLMATALDDEVSINRAYEVGATDFTNKPMNWQVEIHRLRYLLRSADMARQLRLREHETRVAKEAWERTFDAISDVVTLISPDFRVLRANAAARRAASSTSRNLIGARCFEVYQNAAAPCPGCPVAHTLDQRRPASAEIHYQHPDADCLVSASPVFDWEGNLLHVIHVARDLTHRKRLEAEYRQAQKMEAVGTLAGGVAHDFNNILQVIVGYAHLLRTEPGLPEPTRSWADLIVQAAARGSSLARQLLTFSRKGLPCVERRPVQINPLILELHHMLERVLPRAILVHTHLAPDLPPVTASADQLHQVLMNMAVNASQAMPDGGTLTLATRRRILDDATTRLHPGVAPGEFVEVTVSDTGCGMDAATLGRIFEPFFTTKSAGDGTGLGLSVAYGIIREHRGYITCESAPGQGATFHIHLPAAPDAVPQPAPADTPSAEAPPET